MPDFVPGTRIRCRNPWHDDPADPAAWTAHVGFDQDGFPYVFDEVWGIRHVLPDSVKGSSGAS